MNMKLITTLVFVSVAIASEEDEGRVLMYPGPPDDRAPPPYYMTLPTMGILVKMCDAGGVADVFEKGYNAEHDENYLKLRVVEAQFGCTNGQELIVFATPTNDPRQLEMWPEILTFEYVPTNFSRVVFNVCSNFYSAFPDDWNSGNWNSKVSELTIEKSMPFYGFLNTTRSWWYLDYQDGVPYDYWTNLIQVARVEPNWTNYYELVRSGASSTSNRVKEDAFNDMSNLIDYATDEQIQMMLNDSLFPTISQDVLNWDIEYREAKKNPPTP